MNYALVYKPDDVTVKAFAIPEGQQDNIDKIISKHEGITVKGVKITDEQIVGIFTETEFKNLKETLFNVPPAEGSPQKNWDEFVKEAKAAKWYSYSKAQVARSSKPVRKAKGL